MKDLQQQIAGEFCGSLAGGLLELMRRTLLESFAANFC